MVFRTIKKSLFGIHLKPRALRLGLYRKLIRISEKNKLINMAAYNQNKYYTQNNSSNGQSQSSTLWSSGQPTTSPFGQGSTQPKPFTFSQPTPGSTQPSTSAFSPFGSTQPKPFTFSQPKIIASPFGGSTQPKSFTSPSPFGQSSNQPSAFTPFGQSPKLTPFGQSPKLTPFGQGSTHLQPFQMKATAQMVKSNLPRNKIEGLIFMVCMDQRNTIENTKFMLDNALNETKISMENLWFTSLIKYSDPKFALQKVEEKQALFALLYSSFLRELMVESIQTPEDLYSWLVKFATNHKNKKMLWLFTILKHTGKNQFPDVLDLSNALEVFVLALQTFIIFDNNPTQVVEKALQSTNQLYKTFLLSMVGASYGNDYTKNLGSSNHNLLELVNLLV
jgi:hypothetical protein